VTVLFWAILRASSTDEAPASALRSTAGCALASFGSNANSYPTRKPLFSPIQVSIKAIYTTHSTRISQNKRSMSLQVLLLNFYSRREGERYLRASTFQKHTLQETCGNQTTNPLSMKLSCLASQIIEYFIPTKFKKSQLLNSMYCS